jgi:hypothetical protein
LFLAEFDLISVLGEGVFEVFKKFVVLFTRKTPPGEHVNGDYHFSNEGLVVRSCVTEYAKSHIGLWL